LKKTRKEPSRRREEEIKQRLIEQACFHFVKRDWLIVCMTKLLKQHSYKRFKAILRVSFATTQPAPFSKRANARVT
jgi:hypothetical protein